MIKGTVFIIQSENEDLQQANISSESFQTFLRDADCILTNLQGLNSDYICNIFVHFTRPLQENCASTMDLDREDATSLQGGSSDVASEAAGRVIATDSTLTLPDENKNGVSNSSSENGLEVDRISPGHGSGGSEGEKEFEPAEMVRVTGEKWLDLDLSSYRKMA